MTFRLHGPTAADLMGDPAKVARWIESFSDAAPFTVETRVLQSKILGPNRVPARLHLERFEDLVEVLGAAPQVADIERILDLTEQRASELLGWVTAHPREVLALTTVWAQLLDVVAWVLDVAPATYLRDADIPGIDTKFIETHQRVLTSLLLTVLPPERVGPAGSRFAQRFGFLAKPTFTRLRPMRSVDRLPPQLTDVQRSGPTSSHSSTSGSRPRTSSRTRSATSGSHRSRTLWSSSGVGSQSRFSNSSPGWRAADSCTGATSTPTASRSSTSSGSGSHTPSRC